MKLSVAAAAVAAVSRATAAPVHEAGIPSAHDDSGGPAEIETNGRSLAVDHTMYSPLQCNIDAVPAIESEECASAAAAAALSHLVASAAETGAPVVVPCGTCARVDYADGSTVTVPGGLNVVGRLHFPPEASVTLNTTSVIVQGHLDVGVPAGGNKVKITLYGAEEVFFYPHERCCSGGAMNMTVGMGGDHRSLEGACDPDCVHKRSVGKKPIVVAGGQVDIRAVDSTCRSWSTLKDVVQIDDPEGGTDAQGNPLRVTKKFVVDGDFARCVRPGDDLIVTSDTRGGWNDHLEWVAESVSVDATSHGADAGSVSMEGHASPASRPFGFAAEAGPGEPEFAAEVANLRRDVVFEGQRDDPEDDLHGAHFVVFHTPDVVQTISGVRFENFGQAGNLGRYPIHFHMCGASPSIVSKNVITNSNQRCVVIHDTNEVTIDDNVAYKTRGHCYVTETGSEVDNSFTRNLGAETMLLGRINGQSDSQGDGNPHHNEPSTFWIRNTENTWIGNVAAGAQLNGWWFEMTDRVSPLHAFRDNVAHSCNQGFMTYPKNGWVPSNDAVLENFRSYKNSGDGLKFFASGGFTIKNAVIADNLIGVKEFFNDAPIVVRDTRFIGRSRDALLRFGGDSGPAANTGLRYSYNTGNQIQLRNVTFSGFTNNDRAIGPYPELRFGGRCRMGEPLGTVDVTFDGTVEGGARDPLPNDCAWTMYVEDANGTMSPDGKGPGFFVERSDRLTAFIPDGRCSDISAHTTFCENACLRHVEIFPDNEHASAAGGGKYKKLVLTDGTTTFAYIPDDSNSENHFDVLLPPGEYTGHFEDANGTAVVPGGVQFDARSPPLRGECDYVSPSSLTFETTSWPEVKIVNYGAANKYLWAANESGGVGAEENPTEDAVWSIENVQCPANPLYSIPGETCYVLVGGGSSRRCVYAGTNKVWTGGVGTSPSTNIQDDHKWKLVEASCDPSDPRPCVFLVNAYNGRRLYKSSDKPDFGGTPQAGPNAFDDAKWYLEDVGSSPLSSLEIATAAPTASPTDAPTAATPRAKFINYGNSNKYLWATEHNSAWGGLGADENPTENAIWGVEEAACPANPLYSIPGETCYILVGGGSFRRRLFAQSHGHWTAGVGADPFATVYDDQKWKLVKANCDMSDPRLCVFLINAYNGRRLYKSSNSDDFGGTPQSGPNTYNTFDDAKWYLEDVGSIPLSSLDIATAAPTVSPSEAPSVLTQSPTDAPTQAVPMSTLVQFTNYGASSRYLWARDQSSAWGNLGARTDELPIDETLWTIEEVTCPSNPWYTIPGDTCYKVFTNGGSHKRRLFAQGHAHWTAGVGADPGATVWDDQKWKLVPTTCGSDPCFFIVNALHGRRLYKIGADFGAGLKGVPYAEDTFKWRMVNYEA